MSPSPADEPVRRAGPADVDALAGLLARAGFDDARARAEVAVADETWVVGFDQLRGALVLDGDGIVELVVDPALQGQGIDSRLRALAELRRPERS